MKIKKLVVKNYKVFDHLELDFTDKNGQVLDTIVLAGLNGSGKTTILELIEQIFNGTFTNDHLRLNTFIKIEVLISSRNKISKLKNIEDVHSSIKVSPYSENEELVSVEFIYNEISPLEMNNLVSEFVIFSKILARSRRIFNNFGAFDDSKFKGVLIYASDKEKKQTLETNIYHVSFNSDGTETKKNILETAKSRVFEQTELSPRTVFTRMVQDLNIIFKDLDINSKLVEVSDKKLVFKSPNNQNIDFDDLSSGEKMLYFMGFTLNQLNPQDALIMVDEPEDSLHPKWQQQIVRFFNNIGSNNQVILATHSPQIIASVHPESLFVLAINDETNKVEAVNMADEHKYTYGVEPNRILSEIMGTPIRDFEIQQKINALSDIIKRADIDPSVLDLPKIEQEVDALADDFGKQDMTIMRFRNELRLLKRKTMAML